MRIPKQSAVLLLAVLAHSISCPIQAAPAEQPKGDQSQRKPANPIQPLLEAIKALRQRVDESAAITRSLSQETLKKKAKLPAVEVALNQVHSWLAAKPKPGEFSGGLYPRLAIVHNNLVLSLKDLQKFPSLCGRQSLLKAFHDSTKRLNEAVVQAHQTRSFAVQVAREADPRLHEAGQWLWGRGQRMPALELDQYRQHVRSGLGAVADKLAKGLAAKALAPDQQFQVLSAVCGGVGASRVAARPAETPTARARVPGQGPGALPRGGGAPEGPGRAPAAHGAGEGVEARGGGAAEGPAAAGGPSASRERPEGRLQAAPTGSARSPAGPRPAPTAAARAAAPAPGPCPAADKALEAKVAALRAKHQAAINASGLREDLNRPVRNLQELNQALAEIPEAIQTAEEEFQFWDRRWKSCRISDKQGNTVCAEEAKSSRDDWEKQLKLLRALKTGLVDIQEWAKVRYALGCGDESERLAAQLADLKEIWGKRDVQYGLIDKEINPGFKRLGKEERLTPKATPAEIDQAVQTLNEEIQKRTQACKQLTAENRAACRQWQAVKPKMEKLLRDLRSLKDATVSIARLQAELKAAAPSTPAPKFKPAELRMGEFGKENVRFHEQFCKTPCPDPGRKGQFNIGYGHPLLTPAEKKKYAKGITKQQAEELLKQDILSKERELRQKLNKDVELTQNQWDALVSLYYNLIPDAFDGSKVQTNLDAKNYDAARDQMATLGRSIEITDPKTGKKTRKVLPGLERRRLDEIDLWNTP